MKWKIARQHFSNALLLILLSWLIYSRGPSWLEMFRAEGQAAPAIQVRTLSGETLNLPQNKNQVLVFWATWCGPCDVELNRLNQLVKEKKLNGEDIIAVSVMEEAALVADTLKSRDYRFIVALDESGEASKLYQVAGTPTVVLLGADGVIHWKTMGLSPTLEWRVESHLNSKTGI